MHKTIFDSDSTKSTSAAPQTIISTEMFTKLCRFGVWVDLVLDVSLENKTKRLPLFVSASWARILQEPAVLPVSDARA